MFCIDKFPCVMNICFNQLTINFMFLYIVYFVMGHEVGSYLGLDEIGSSSPMMIYIIINYLFNRTYWICLLGFFVGAYK